MRVHSFACAAAAVLTVPACGTQEIGPNPITYVRNTPGPNTGELMVGFPSPSDSFEEEQARVASVGYARYFLFLDGRQLAWEVGGTSYPVEISEGTLERAGFLPSGRHHLAVVAAEGTTVFAGDAEIVPGLMNRLYLVGRLGALQGLFISYRAPAPTGMLHVSVINLVRDGRSLEVVSCANDCTPVSGPRAFGESVGSDFQAADANPFALADGRRIGWRQVPTAAVPAPPVQLITWFPVGWVDPPPTPPPPAFAIAPVYLSPQGDALSTF